MQDSQNMPADAEAPDVTVAVAAWNAEPWLERCLEDICAQTLRNVEILVFVDGATDGTAAIARRFADRDSRIRVFEGPNMGLGACRNKAILLARGEYLSMLDADDEFDPEMLETALAEARKTRADILCFGYRWIDERTGRKAEGRGAAAAAREGRNLAGMTGILSVSNAAPWNKLWRTAFIREQKLAFDSLAIGEDAKFAWCAYALAERIFCLRRDLMTYHVHKDNASCSGWRRFSCLADAVDSALRLLCRRGRADMTGALFKALLPHVTGRLGGIPADADPVPFLVRMLSAVPRRFLAGQWQVLERFCRGPRAGRMEAAVRALSLAEAARPALSLAVRLPASEAGTQELLASLQEQSLQDAEFICIGTDAGESAPAADRIAMADPRFLHCRLEGGSAADARRTGAFLARGRTYAFLDGGEPLKDRNALAGMLVKAIPVLR